MKGIKLMGACLGGIKEILDFQHRWKVTFCAVKRA